MQRTGYFSVLSLYYKNRALKMTPVLSEALRLKALRMYSPYSFRKEIHFIMSLIAMGKLQNAIQSKNCICHTTIDIKRQMFCTPVKSEVQDELKVNLNTSLEYVLLLIILARDQIRDMLGGQTGKFTFG